MKPNNLITVTLKALTFFALAFGITNCSKSNDSGNIGLNNGLRMVNNICYQGVTQVATTTCTQMNAPMYQMQQNGMCYQILPNGQTIPQQNTSLCTAGGYGYGANGTCAPQYVNGQYVQQPYCNSGMNGAYGINGGINNTQCNGLYHDNQQTVMCNSSLPPGGGMQYVNGVNSMNCSNYRLYDQYNQVVYCL